MDPKAKQLGYYSSMSDFRVYLSDANDQVWLEWGPRSDCQRIDPVTSQQFWKDMLNNTYPGELRPAHKYASFLDVVSKFGQGGKQIGYRESQAADAFFIFQKDTRSVLTARVASPLLSLPYDLDVFEDGIASEALQPLLTLVAAETHSARWIGLGREGVAFATAREYRIAEWRSGALRPTRSHLIARCGLPGWVRTLGGVDPAVAGMDAVAALAVTSPDVWHSHPYSYPSDPDVWFFGD
ncbi:hypothetical protein [Gemmata obscuriglobus]|uniref:hypothetical protein n=1 Tax=Gemmata obscuriglobus TaxID=114 RepID=UPI0011CDE8F8|nr:hypothetical protein [Gemmata obscuriglobus]